MAEPIKGDPKIFGFVFAANYYFGEIVDNNIASGSGLVTGILELPCFELEYIKELANNYLHNNIISFSEEEIKFCYEKTKGYPYFVQKMFYNMYEQRKKSTLVNDKYFQNLEIIFKNDFESSIKNWGNTMSSFTIDKIKLIMNSLTPDKQNLSGFLAR